MSAAYAAESVMVLRGGAKRPHGLSSIEAHAAKIAARRAATAFDTGPGLAQTTSPADG